MGLTTFSVLNGDLITGENTFKENSTVYIDEIVNNLNEAQIPFSSTYGVSCPFLFLSWHLCPLCPSIEQSQDQTTDTLIHQNHDNNPNITHMAEFLREKQVSPRLSYTRILPSGGIYGPGNYWVPVRTDLCYPCRPDARICGNG